MSNVPDVRIDYRDERSVAAYHAFCLAASRAQIDHNGENDAIVRTIDAAYVDARSRVDSPEVLADLQRAYLGVRALTAEQCGRFDEAREWHRLEGELGFSSLYSEYEYLIRLVSHAIRRGDTLGAAALAKQAGDLTRKTRGVVDHYERELNQLSSTHGFSC